MTKPRYVELHAHSYFSLLDGASSPQELLAAAAALEMPALALTDHNNLHGAMLFAEEARSLGIQAIFGAEMTLEDRSHLTLLVRNEQGWANLCQLISLAQAATPKGEASLPYSALEAFGTGLVALSGCSQGAVSQALKRGEKQRAKKLLGQFCDYFSKGHVWLELQHHRLPGDTERNEALMALGKELELGVVATNNVHYACREQSQLQDLLVAIRHKLSLDEAAPYLRANRQYVLKSGAELASVFPAAILENSLAIAEACRFEPRYGLQDLPDFPIPDGLSPKAYLRWLCQASPRYAHPERLDYELETIDAAGLSNYFLLVYELLRHAREQGIRCQGRGSAASSLVAYLLEISPIDPVEHELVFERFLSKERALAPDIDIDFSAGDERELVLQHLYSRYGREHAAMACTMVCYRRRSAVRDVGKALGIPPALLDALSQEVDRQGASPQERLLTSIPETPLWRQFAELVEAIQGIPHHLGIHSGGMILMKSPLSSRLPTEPAKMLGRSVVQWDKDSLEAAALVKIDVLGLKMLTVLSEASAAAGVNLNELRFDDPKVFAMISDADTVGIFQVESRAQMQMLPRFRPNSFQDLIICISLIRPGPLQGNMVHPYIRRRLGEEPIAYLHPLLKPVLEETLGVILFQEQLYGENVKGKVVLIQLFLERR